MKYLDKLVSGARIQPSVYVSLFFTELFRKQILKYIYKNIVKKISTVLIKMNVNEYISFLTYSIHIYSTNFI